MSKSNQFFTQTEGTEQFWKSQFLTIVCNSNHFREISENFEKFQEKSKKIQWTSTNNCNSRKMWYRSKIGWQFNLGLINMCHVNPNPIHSPYYAPKSQIVTKNSSTALSILRTITVSQALIVSKWKMWTKRRIERDKKKWKKDVVALRSDQFIQIQRRKIAAFFTNCMCWC